MQKAFDEEAKDKSSRARGWAGTLNNYTEAEYKFLCLNQQRATYSIIGKEIGEEGTPHLQMFFYFKNKAAFKTVKALAPRAHWESIKGTPYENYMYCSKGGDYLECGDRPLSPEQSKSKSKDKQRQRNEEMWGAAKNGKFEELPPAQIHQWEYIHSKYGSTPDDRSVLHNYWLTGVSGCGKSSAVRKVWSDGCFYNKPLSKWWCGYNHEEVIVIEDVEPSNASWLGYFLKIWGDHYAFNAEVKGGSFKIRPKVILVTSQYTIDNVFSSTDAETVTAVSRRFKQVFYGAETIPLLQSIKDSLLPEEEQKEEPPVVNIEAEELVIEEPTWVNTLLFEETGEVTEESFAADLASLRASIASFQRHEELPKRKRDTESESSFKTARQLDFDSEEDDF